MNYLPAVTLGLYLLGGVATVALIANISEENGTLKKASCTRAWIEFTIAFVMWPLLVLITLLLTTIKFILKLD